VTESIMSPSPPTARLRLFWLVCISFAFSFQLCTRLAAVLAEEVDDFFVICFFGPI
jgi:hypothetical protein